MNDKLPFDDEFEPTVGSVLESLPGLARIAASATARTAVWGAGAYVRTGRRVLDAMASPQEAAALRDEVAETAQVVSDVAQALGSGVPLAQAVGRAAAHMGERRREAAGNGHRPAPDDRALPPPEELRARGARLLDRSSDVFDEDTGHPAYVRMLDELAPDEARILLLLVREGPQPSVDVRTGGPVGMVSSRLISAGMTMLGARAGLRHVDNVPQYLNNLFRLGLVWLSYESLTDPMEYQVLEAQPDVLAALHSARFTKVVRRSVHLTPFGIDFCRSCLVDDADSGDELPEHADPGQQDHR